jgi:hypothetical protein
MSLVSQIKHVLEHCRRAVSLIHMSYPDHPTHILLSFHRNGRCVYGVDLVLFARSTAQLTVDRLVGRSIDRSLPRSLTG